MVKIKFCFFLYIINIYTYIRGKKKYIFYLKKNNNNKNQTINNILYTFVNCDYILYITIIILEENYMCRIDTQI